MVLNIGQQDGPKPKCYFTHSTLPTYIDNANPPTKKEPFKTTLAQQYSHTLTLLLPPSPSQQLLHETLASPTSADGLLRYARVYMKLLDIISGDFFNSYIKSGNVTMLSEGRAGIDNVFSLCEGILRLEVDKPTFEKLGLEGRVVAGEGRKHVKARFEISINLRLPSMVSGKKAFERLQWAFKNVLTDSLAWLFYDLRSPAENKGALAAHAPLIKTLTPQTETLENVLCPPPPQNLEDGQREQASEYLEWLTLTMARSPRVLKGDEVDPFLCRYRPAGESEGAECTNLVLYQWRGFVPVPFVMRVLLAALKCSTSEGWFALAATAFEGSGYTVLRKEAEVMTWNYDD